MKIKIIITIIVVGLAALAFVSLKKNELESSNINTNPELNLYQSPASELVKTKLASMTLREKIAQMIISSTIPENFSVGSAEFKKIKRLAENTKVGGFIFFKGSSTDYVRLSNHLQSFSETPLLISADFERGTKMRLTDGTLFPNNMAIGAADNKELSYKMGLEIARETRLIGVHQNYAPVCDVNNNPNNPIINVRSFGEDPELVSRMSESMIKGLQDGKVIATAKHFPGHGDTEIDSHNDLPMLNFPMDRLEKIELVPFKNAIEKNVMSVMIAHLAFPELEKGQNIPSSLSQNIVQDLLIDKMGFGGLVVTDALNMKGITKYFNTSQVAVMCVNAGIDLILMPLDEEKSISAIESAVLSGSINEERINRSAEKILKAKEWLGLFENRYVKEDGVFSSMNSTLSGEIAAQIADESITLVKDDMNILPVNSTGKKTAAILISEGGDGDNTSYLSASISSFFESPLILNATTGSTDPYLLNNAQELAGYDNIFIFIYAKVRFGTGKISISSKNIQLIEEIVGINNKTVVVSLGSPYLLKEFPQIPSYICAYGDSDVSIDAVLKAINGKNKFKGKLPITVAPGYNFGTGILK